MPYLCTLYLQVWQLLQGRIIGLIVAETKELGHLAKEDRSILASSFKKGTKVGYILSLGNFFTLEQLNVIVVFYALMALKWTFAIYLFIVHSSSFFVKKCYMRIGWVTEIFKGSHHGFFYYTPGKLLMCRIRNWLFFILTTFRPLPGGRKFQKTQLNDHDR